MNIFKVSAGIIICSVLTAFSVSCAVPESDESFSVSDLQDSFSCNAVINYGELKAESYVKQYSKGIWENEFISPDTVSGVKLSFNNDDVNASYKGLAFSVPKSAMPFQSMLICMIEAVDSIYSLTDLPCTEQEGVICCNGTLEQGDYTICFDSKTGYIQSFEMPNMKLMIEFSECSSDVVYTTEISEVLETDISDEESSNYIADTTVISAD